jgi:hypothetical protein
VRDLCKKHGTACEAWPRMSADEIGETCESNKHFGAEFNVASGYVGVSPNPFMNRGVDRRLMLGRKWEVFVGYVSVLHFEAHFDCTTVQALARVSHAYDFHGNRYDAVAMKPDSIPAGLPHTVGSVYVREEFGLNEFFLSSHEQLRDAQAMDTLQYLVEQDAADHRGKDLKADNILDLPSYISVKVKADKFKDARAEKNADMQASFTALLTGTQQTPTVVRSASRFGQASTVQAGQQDNIRRETLATTAATNLATSRAAPRARSGTLARTLPPKASGAVARPKAKAATFFGVGVAAAVKSSPQISPLLSGLLSPVPARRPAEVVTPMEPNKRGRYQRKEINLQEIFNGAAPGRQTTPVNLGACVNYIHMSWDICCCQVALSGGRPSL